VQCTQYLGKADKKGNTMTTKERIPGYVTLEEAVHAILFARDFPQYARDYQDLAFLLEQRPGAVRKILRRKGETP